MSDQEDVKASFELDEINAAFREVLALASGKRVLFWILEQAAIYRDAFGGTDAATNYTLGLQAGGRRLLQKFDEIDPRLYPRLLLDVADMKAMDIAARAAKPESENAEAS